MSKIFYIMGKSASGKDSLYSCLLADPDLGLKRLVLYTTRPIRAGEKEGREYHFTDEEGMELFRREGRVIEERTYQTVAGPWTYATVDDGRDWAATGPYLAIGTLESYVKMLTYFNDAAGPEPIIASATDIEPGTESASGTGTRGESVTASGSDTRRTPASVELIPLYVEVSDPVRLKRAIDRETAQSAPNYQEVCRRFLADSEDFSEEKIAEAGITRRFANDGAFEACLHELEEFIRNVL